jgi:DNA polymerase-3 subunit delta'
MAFAEVLDQGLAVSILQNSLRQERLHHAYLFLGETGVGKEQTALELAKAINCRQQKVDGCDNCLSCKKVASGNHPDLKVLEPEGNYLKIDQIRSLQQEILYKPYESQRKVYIIKQAETMTTEAANSLLKILEDPPDHGIIILLSNNLNKLLPTVISRCEVIRFKRIAKEALTEKLRAEYDLTEEKRQLITSLAFGKVSEAVKLVEEEDNLAWRKEIIELLLSFKGTDRLKAFAVVQELLELKEQINEVLGVFLTWYRDILLLKLGKKEEIVNADYYEDLQERADLFTLEQAEEALELIANTNNLIKNVNVNLQLRLEVMLLKLNKIRRQNR